MAPIAATNSAETLERRAPLRYSAIAAGLSLYFFGSKPFLIGMASPRRTLRCRVICSQQHSPGIMVMICPEIQIIPWGISHEKATSSAFGGHGLLRSGTGSRYAYEGGAYGAGRSVRDPLDRSLDLGRLRIWVG